MCDKNNARQVDFSSGEMKIKKDANDHVYFDQSSDYLYLHDDRLIIGKRGCEDIVLSHVDDIDNFIQAVIYLKDKILSTTTTTM